MEAELLEPMSGAKPRRSGAEDENPAGIVRQRHPGAPCAQRGRHGLAEGPCRGLPQAPFDDRDRSRPPSAVRHPHLANSQPSPGCQPRDDHVRRERLGRDHGKNRLQARAAHEPIGCIDVRHGVTEQRPHRGPGHRGDEPARQRGVSVLSPADQQIEVVSSRPEPLEVLRSHLVVTVDLKDPFAASLAIAAEDRRPVTRVRLARHDEAGLIVGEPLEDAARLVPRPVVVREELVVEAEALELLQPRGYDFGDHGALVVHGHHDRQLRLGEVAVTSTACLSGFDGRPERWQAAALLCCIQSVQSISHA